jgi:hypothetical protein
MRAVSGAQLGGRGSVGSGLADLGSLLGQPTPACLLVCALLDAVRRAAAEQLGDANLTAFLKEVGLGDDVLIAQLHGSSSMLLCCQQGRRSWSVLDMCVDYPVMGDSASLLRRTLHSDTMSQCTLL